MFTVKWKYDVDGVSRERVFDADQVEVAYDNRNEVPKGCPVSQVSAKLGIYYVPPRGVVVIGNPHQGSDSMAFTFGKVYVMNAEGATVSTYTLDTDPHGYSIDASGCKSVPPTPHTLDPKAQDAVGSDMSQFKTS